MLRNVLVVGVLALATACGLPWQKVAKTALDEADSICLTAKADLPTVEAAMEACGIEAALAPIARIVIDDFKSKRAAYAVRRMAESNCSGR